MNLFVHRHGWPCRDVDRRCGTAAAVRGRARGWSRNHAALRHDRGLAAEGRRQPGVNRRCRRPAHDRRGPHGWDPTIPIVAEESPLPPATLRATWRRYWLVDPLDGTKEFLARNGEFTVNIALIDERAPVLGVVLAPAFESHLLRRARAWRLASRWRLPPRRISSGRWRRGSRYAWWRADRIPRRSSRPSSRPYR